MSRATLPNSQNGAQDFQVVQVFTPDPAKSVAKTVPAGGNVVWTIPADTSIFAFYPTCGVKVTLNSNSVGISYPEAQLAGPLGIHPATTSIKFTDTGSGGGTVSIEAM